jgi:autotransporter strand-loop-strand O-heptosyltransferase
MQKLNRSYLLYGTESYISVLEECAKSIREFSNIHILIYLINSDKKINLENSTTINWEMDLSETDLYTQNSDGNFYIKREKNDIFKILTERVKILKDSLLNRSEIVTYIDSDSVATHNIDRIFDLYQNQPYVMATEGIHDWLHVGDRGGSMDPNDLSTTLEHPACELFKVNQYVRERYRTTNIFIAGQNSLDFIDEWISMCNHPEVLKNKEWYASYHEETLYNVLLWKYNYIIGLPYLYTNGTVEDVVDIYEKNLFTGNGESISEWKRFPTSEKNLLVFHGEKRIEKMSEMRQILKDNNNKIKTNNGHFDFIEIGTSDFDTLIESSNNNEWGISVEPIKFYLDKLPNKKNVFKEQSAIALENGDIDIYYIDEEDIQKHNLPWWVRGSNSVSSPHKFTIKELGEDLYYQIVRKEKVKTITWSTLFEKYNVKSVDYLKIDTEGFDHIIFKDFLDYCELNKFPLPNKITLEYHTDVSNLPEIDKLISKLPFYLVYKSNSDITLIKSKIPRIIHQTYKTNDLPKEILEVINKLKSMNPTFEYRFYNDADCENFIRENYDEETLNLYLKINPIYGSAKSDFFRYLLMYKVGGVYLDIKSTTTKPLEKILLPTDEYLLSHWAGLDWAKELNYEFGEFQNWHIICKPEHPFLLNVIEQVKKNIKYFKGGSDKNSVLFTTGPVAYSKSILKLLHQHKTNSNISPVREYKLEHEIGLKYMGTKIHHHKILGKSFDRFEPLVLNTTPNLIKILFLAPHLSTGGMPSFLLKRIESLLEYSKELELYVVEFSNHSDHFVVQKNKIKELLPPSHFWTLGQDKMELINIIEENEFDIIHLDEMIEAFDFHNPMTPDLMNYLYKNDRTWKIVETCHNIIFQPNLEKHFHPESYAYCTPWHKENTFKEMPSYGEVFEFPIENKIPSSTEKIESKLKLGFNPNKKHVVNVGLWTSGKNQKEGVELARLIEKTNPEYQFHFVGNQAPNFQDYWQPLMNDLPSNVKVWGERNDVNLFLTASDIFMFNSTWECNPLVLRESISYGLPTLSRNLPQYMDMFTNYIHPIDDDINKTKETLLSLKEERHFNIPEGQGEKFALDHFKFYQLVNSKEPKQQTKINSNIKIIQYFVNQPFLEIKGNSDSTFEIKFFDEFGFCHYQNKTKSNHWFKLNRQYFTKWNTKVWEDGTLIYDDTLNYKGKKVFISFDSGSLGDTIAWIPYVLEFKKKHECDVVVSTHKNFLFEKVYPELEFVKPGSTVNGIHGMYVIGWFYDPDKEPMMPNTIPLQQAATNILGLDYTEIQPRIDYVIGGRPYEQKYVSIATNSTAGCKFWTKEGWQGLIDHLHSLGYKVINVSKEKNPFNHAEQISDTSMENTMNIIHHSEFFIGLSSGLSWLAWGMGKHVVMISNFTEPDHEFTTNCTRIVKLDVCNGCWNSPIYKFDKGNFNWCPLHEGTSRQFECHTTITSEMVIKQIQHLLT